MKKNLYFLALFVLLKVVTTATVYDVKPKRPNSYPMSYSTFFETWMKEHNKMYTYQELQLKRKIFFENLWFIEQSNMQNNSYLLGTNQYSDMATEDFGARTGSEFTRNVAEFGFSYNFDEIPSIEEVSQHPPQKDWVYDGCVPAPRQQNMNCGQSAGAHTATNSAQSNWYIKHKTGSELSSQYVLDCKNGGTYVCGNDFSDLYAYFLFRDKAYNKSEYPGPITGLPGNCAIPQINGSTKYNDGPAEKFKMPILINYFDTGMESTLLKYTFTAQIKVPSDIVLNYKSGVVTAQSCRTKGALYYTVLVVGYDKTANPPFWKVQFAFGENWGMQGYILIEKVNGGKDAGPCQIAENPAYIPPL